MALGSSKGVVRVDGVGFIYKEAIDNGMDRSHRGDSEIWAWQENESLPEPENSVLLVSCCCYNNLPPTCLKQHKVRSQKWVLWAKIKGTTGLISWLKALRENQFSHFFQLLEVSCIPWLVAPFSIFTASSSG